MPQHSNIHHAAVYITVCGESWLSGGVRNLQARDCRFSRQLGWKYCGAVPLCKAFTHMCTLSTQMPEVSGRTMEASVRLNSSQCCDGCRAVYCLGSWDGLWMNRSCDQGAGNRVKLGERCFVLDTRLETSTFTFYFGQGHPAVSVSFLMGCSIQRLSKPCKEHSISFHCSATLTLTVLATYRCPWDHLAKC